jgi:hypothetical protein
MADFDHAGRRYGLDETYRVDLGAFLIELTDRTGDPPVVVASLVCREDTSDLLVSAEFPGAPAEAIEQLIALGRARLPEWAKRWDSALTDWPGKADG